MKKRNIIAVLLALLSMLVIGASVASAEVIGDNYSINGIGLGWILIGISALLMVLAHPKVGILKKFSKPAYTVLIVALLIGFAMQFVTVDDVADGTGANTVVSGCPDFDVSGIPITSGTNYITTATFDNDTMTLTVPLTVADSSDGNLTDHKTGVNLSVDPIAIPGMLSTNMATISFETDYLMKYGGEYILDETSGDYEATWTVGSNTHRYAGSVDMDISDNKYLQIDYTFENSTAGNWVTELSQIGDTATWYITLSDACGNNIETITVNAIVVSYTA